MTTEVLKYSLRDGEAIVKTVSDVEPILEHNKDLRSMPQKSDWGRQVAVVPVAVLHKWLVEEWNKGHEVRLYSEEYYRMVWDKLNDPDWANLRVDK